MNRFVLIDGNAIMHRAFHAYPPLTSPDGELVNAVYGFFAMFLKILESVEPEFVAVCFDRPTPTFRKIMYVGYQATRPSMVDGLGSQMKLVHTILEKGTIPIFEIDGYEADDLIGTLALQATMPQNQKEEIEVIIVSGDRDLLQLVNERVKMLAPVTGITKMILYDQDLVKEKFGIEPSQVVDYKALTGDASDNYPGVAGIGPKTAKDLLLKYKTFEELYQNLSKLPVKIAEKLAKDAEQAALAKKLATIVTDVPVSSFECDKCTVSTINISAMKQEFEKLGMKSIQNRFPDYITGGNQKAKRLVVKENGQLELL